MTPRILEVTRSVVHEPALFSTGGDKNELFFQKHSRAYIRAYILSYLYILKIKCVFNSTSTTCQRHMNHTSKVHERGRTHVLSALSLIFALKTFKGILSTL